MLLRTCLTTALLLLAACSESPQGVATPVGSVTPTPATVVAPVITPKTGVTFTANPASIRRCDAKDGNTKVALAWDVTAAGVQFVTINIGDKVFAQGAASGSAATGEWVRDDTVFTLLDAANREPIATLKIPFVDC